MDYSKAVALSANYGAMSVEDFAGELAGKDNHLGGGGASALAGALGAALAAMVANITLAKLDEDNAKTAVKGVLQQSQGLKQELIELISGDAAALSMLMKAYSTKGKSAQQLAARDKDLQDSLAYACELPLQIIDNCGSAIKAHKELLTHCSQNIISDVAAGAALCLAAIRVAALNVYINGRDMKDRTLSARYIDKAKSKLASYTLLTDEIYEHVSAILLTAVVK